MSIDYQRILQELRDRKANDVFRYVRLGDMPRAMVAVGAVDGIDEMLRTLDFMNDANVRIEQAQRERSERKPVARARVLRAKEVLADQKKESGHERVG